MTGAIDYSDPCAVLAVLRPAYYAILGGSNAEIVKFSAGNGTSREVTYTRVSITKLEGEIRRLEEACYKQTNGKTQRYAVTAYGANSRRYRCRTLQK